MKISRIALYCATALLCLLVTCELSNAAPVTVQLPCSATSIALNTPPTSATAQCPSTPLPPPPISSSTCIAGAKTDLPGVTLICSGSFVRHDGACNPLASGSCPSVSGPYSFANVFGPWPGKDHASDDEIFKLQTHQALSIPFTPSPGHSTSFFVNSTYMPDNNAVFSISTVPGLFNNGRKNGSTVICAAGHNPNLTTSSNGRANVGCVLDPGKQYWLNMAPGIAVNSVFTGCQITPCVVSVQEQFQD